MKSSSGNFPAKRWTITKIAKTASQNIENLDTEVQERVFRCLEEIEADPFHGNIRKIEGKSDIFRIRISDYRLYFRLISDSRSIEILLFESRGAIKRKTIQRMEQADAFTAKLETE